MSNPLSKNAVKLIVETIVDDMLTQGIDYMTVAEAVEEEFPGLDISEEDLVRLHQAVRQEMIHVHSLWVFDE